MFGTAPWLTHCFAWRRSRTCSFSPVAGGSRDNMVIESSLAGALDGTEASFYRTAAGAEVDLVLELPGSRVWAIEVKRGFYNACEYL